MTNVSERETLCEKVADLDSYTHTALTRSNYVREQRYFLCAEIQKLVSEIMNMSIRAKKGMQYANKINIFKNKSRRF